ncbi:hypothetical protein AA313_de0203351 [Arthrobotrys entomopaga]|nr:hypothetical protein AA313_de0203351 [Arthrobotrys entomopaga]
MDDEMEELVSKLNHLEQNLNLAPSPATFPSLQTPSTPRKPISWPKELFSPTSPTSLHNVPSNKVDEEVMKYHAALRYFESNVAKLDINVEKLEARITEEQSYMIETGVYPRLLRVGEKIKEILEEVEARDGEIKALLGRCGKCIENGRMRLEILGRDRYRIYKPFADLREEGKGDVKRSGVSPVAT